MTFIKPTLSGLYLPRGTVQLICPNEHDHVMGWEQAQRLYMEPCCWCGEPFDCAHYGPQVPIRLQLPGRAA